MTCFVTGAAGFIGSNFCHWLIKNTEHYVVGIDDLSGGYADNMPSDDRFIFFKVSVLDARRLQILYSDFKPVVTFHFACYAAEGRSNHIRNFIHSNNTVGVANIINCCINHNSKLIFTSSVAVYSGEPPFTEETLPNPIDCYGASKYVSEIDIRIAGEQQGLDWCIVRPRNVYGERQSLWDSARNVIGIWSNQILNDKPMTIFGDGSNKRSFTYVGDILKPLYEAINVSKEIINLGASNIYSIEVANLVLRSVAKYDRVDYLPERHEVKEAWCLTDKSKRLLGFEDKTDLMTGIEIMWNWAKAQPKRTMQTSPKLEVTKYAHSSLL